MALLSILLPAFAAGLVVLASHVVMGRQVLRRGIIFIDLAIAQVAAVGAVLAVAVHDLEHLPLVHWWLPLLFALAGAALIAWFERVAPTELEALIGCLYVIAAVAAMLVLANDPHGGELLKQLLSGQILWTDWDALVWPAVFTAVVCGLMLGRPALANGRWFYPLFALMITFSVQLVGVYLVFASLILPALAGNRFSGAKSLLIGYGVGVLGYLVGLALSAYRDLPAGATVVISLAAMALLARLLLRPTTAAVGATQSN